MTNCDMQVDKLMLAIVQKSKLLYFNILTVNSNFTHVYYYSLPLSMYILSGLATVCNFASKLVMYCFHSSQEVFLSTVGHI